MDAIRGRHVARIQRGVDQRQPQSLAGGLLQPVIALVPPAPQVDDGLDPAPGPAGQLSGRRLVLKNNLDAETAEKYRTTLERAGARVHVEAMSPPATATPPAERLPAVEEQTVEEVELAPPPDEPSWTRRTAQAAGSQSPPAVPRDLYAAAFMDVVAPDFTLARTGSDVQDPKPAPVAPALDLSRLSLAPVGSDMGQVAKPQAAPAPDTSHLKVL